MTNHQSTENLFEAIGKDPLSWLEQAQEMKTIADAILPLLKSELDIRPNFPGTQRKRLAYVGSYMLFIGLAFENLIKGILIRQNPALVTKEKIESRILGRKGHGIEEGAKRIINLNQQELQLLARLEEYLIWAGRYPLPIKSNLFLNSENQNLRTFRNSDPLLIDELFIKLVEFLENPN